MGCEDVVALWALRPPLTDEFWFTEEFPEPESNVNMKIN